MEQLSHLEKRSAHSQTLTCVSLNFQNLNVAHDITWLL
jgi:hypothetical protein